MFLQTPQLRALAPVPVRAEAVEDFPLQPLLREGGVLSASCAIANAGKTLAKRKLTITSNANTLCVYTNLMLLCSEK